MTDDATPIGDLHHAKAAGLVRAAETLPALAELEFEEREGRGRSSVLEAVSERAGQLVQSVDRGVVQALLDAIVEQVGETAVAVTEALRQALASDGATVEASRSEQTATAEALPVEVTSDEPPTQPVEVAEVTSDGVGDAGEQPEPKPPAKTETRGQGRVLIGPQVFVATDNGIELRASTELWGRRGKDRR